MNQILVNEKIIVTPEFRRKKKIYKFNFFLSVFLACTLFSCYIYAEYDRNKGEQVSQEILLSMTGAEQEENTVQNQSVSIENDILVVKLNSIQSGEAIPIAETNGTTQDRESIEVKVSELEGQRDEPVGLFEAKSNDGTYYYPEARLRIPSLGIDLAVLPDTSDELLKISLNKLWGPEPNEVGNYVIIGHNYRNKTMFGKLPGINIGDTFELEDASGRNITYKVYDKYEVEPTNVQCTSQLTNGKKEVTLITCNSNGKKRIIVKGTEVL